MTRILFLCTGNYYRSRYAEVRFDMLATRAGLPHRAASRGLRVDFAQKFNKGPISPDALSRLSTFDLPGMSIRSTRSTWPTLHRMPMDVMPADFEHSLKVIALKLEEHRPMMLERFPAWADRIEYWLVNDVPPTEAYDPLKEIDRLVAELVERLR